MFSFSRRGRTMVRSHSLNKQQKNMIFSGGYKMHTTANHISTDDDVRGLCKQGQLKEALHVLQVSEKPAGSLTYACLLQECSKKRAILEGRSVHAHMTQMGFVPERFLYNTLLNMFAKCGSLVEARRVFDGMPERDAFSWTVMISAYARHGLVEESLALFRQMQWTEIKADQFTFAGVFPAMGSLDQGRAIHAGVIRSGFQSDVFVGSALVDMYAKCRSLEDSRQVFDEIRQRDVVLWNAMIVGYARNGYVEEAMKTFEEMPMRNVVSWNAVIAGCTQNGHVDEALKFFHAMPERNLVSWNAIIAANVRDGRVDEALNLFWGMPERDVVSWTTMIAGYVQNGHDERALELYREMQLSGVKPNLNTFAGVLPACASCTTLKHGMGIHEEIIRRGFQSDLIVGNALVDMYAKCGVLEIARDLFDKMPQRNVVSWTAMIVGYAQNGCEEQAIQLFEQMQLTDGKPNAKTFASVLSACANLGALERGIEIHKEVVRNGFQSEVSVGNALVDMYAKCGSIEDARALFDEIHKRNVISWTTMIAGYVKNGYFDEALNLFQEMPERNVVSWTVMIAGCAQNGYIDEALELFQDMPKRNMVSWNAMLAGYVQNGYNEEALRLFLQMQLAGVKPNSKTFASVLKACSDVADLELGMGIHGKIVRSGFQSDIFVENTVIDMYAKCASIENARKEFDRMLHRDVVSWNAMIAGYAQNGLVNEALNLFLKMPDRDVISWTAIIAGHAQNGKGEEALKLFQQMQQSGTKLNRDTIASVLSACANLAALEQGKQIHEEIVRNGLESDVFVGSALLDMYAKCGNIEIAHKLFDKMSPRNVVAWTAMIVGYAMHGRCKEALNFFEQMQRSGTRPNPVTFLGVLSACCHAGLVDEGQLYFNYMKQHYHITPTMEHYGCMIDLLGRAGHLDEAWEFINKMGLKPDAMAWMSLLGACRIHNNVGLGECVAKRLFELDPQNAAPYILLSNIYAEAGRRDDIEKVRKMMRDRRVRKDPGCSWIEVNK